MLEKLESLYSEALTSLESITDSASLHEWEIRFLGKKGQITELLRGVGSLPKEDRAAFGKRANESQDRARSHLRRARKTRP